MMSTQATRETATAGIPAELQGAVPRRVRLTGGGLALAVIAIALATAAVVSAIVMSIAYDRQDRQRQLRARQTVAVQAEVVDVTLRRGEHPRRIITYRYEVDGRLHTGRVSLGERVRRDITLGTLVPIGYVASDPGESWMVGYEPKGFPLLLIPLVPIALLFAAAAMAWGLRRKWVLLSEGRAALARITGHKKVRHEKHHAYRVSYQFQTLSGATRTGSYEVGKNPPAVGTTQPIVYHRENPGWNAKYPVQLVRPERPQRSVR